MKSDSQMIAIFDLDGTLTKKDTYLPFLWLCLKEFGLRSLSLIMLPIYFILYISRLISNHQLKELFLNKILNGISLKQLDPIIDKFVSGIINHGLNGPIINILNQHLKQGHRVILATASFDFYVTRLAERIGIYEVVCTKAEIRNGIITGRILGKNCHGEEKVRRINSLLSHQDLISSIFYTDHRSDYPLLSKVEKGIIVNPGLMNRLTLKKHNFTFL